MVKKILLIAGHGNGDPGACSVYGTENTEAVRVVNEIALNFNPYEVTIDVYPINRNAYQDVCNGNPAVNFADYDYIFEVHFNSSADPASLGTEIFVPLTETGTDVEQKVVNNVAALGFVNRGVKKEAFAVITSAKNRGTSAALMETCFISNEQDMKNYNNKFKEVCKAMTKGIVDGFDIKEKVVKEPTYKVMVGSKQVTDKCLRKWLPSIIETELKYAPSVITITKC